MQLPLLGSNPGLTPDGCVVKNRGNSTSQLSEMHCHPAAGEGDFSNWLTPFFSGPRGFQEAENERTDHVARRLYRQNAHAPSLPRSLANDRLRFSCPER